MAELFKGARPIEFGVGYRWRKNESNLRGSVMTKKLKGLRVDEVSSVDNGANPDAKILLMKRDDKTNFMVEVRRGRNALIKSVESIMQDDGGEDKKSLIEETFEQCDVWFEAEAIKLGIDISKNKEPTTVSREEQLATLKKFSFRSVAKYIVDEPKMGAAITEEEFTNSTALTLSVSRAKVVTRHSSAS